MNRPNIFRHRKGVCFAIQARSTLMPFRFEGNQTMTTTKTTTTTMKTSNFALHWSQRRCSRGVIRRCPFSLSGVFSPSGAAYRRPSGAALTLAPILILLALLPNGVPAELNFSPARDGIVNLDPLTIWTKVIQNKVNKSHKTNDASSCFVK